MSKIKDTSKISNSSAEDKYIASNSTSYMPGATKFLDNILSYRIMSHAIYWIAVVLITAYQGSLFGGTVKDNLISMSTVLPIQMAVAYLLIYWQIPQLLFKGKKVFFFISVIVIAYLASVCARLATIYIAEPLMGYEGIDESLFEILGDPIYLILVYVAPVFFPAILFFLIRMTKKKFEHEKHLAILQEEKKMQS